MDRGSLALVFNESKNQILVVKRRDVPMWCLPGGGSDPGETPEETAIREVLEETGFHIEVVSKIGVYTRANRLAAETHFFECKAIGGAPQFGPETLDVKFAPLNDLPDPFFYIHKDFMRDAFSDIPKPFSMPFYNVTYWALAKYFICHPIQVFRMALSKLGLPINGQSN